MVILFGDMSATTRVALPIKEDLAA